MADNQEGASEKKAVALENLTDGQEIAITKIFPLDPSKGVSTVRVADKLRVVKFNPAAEGTIMCGW